MTNGGQGILQNPEKNWVPQSLERPSVFGGAPCRMHRSGSMAEKQSIDIEKGKPNNLQWHALDWKEERLCSAARATNLLQSPVLALQKMNIRTLARSPNCRSFCILASKLEAELCMLSLGMFRLLFAERSSQGTSNSSLQVRWLACNKGA